LLLDGAEVFVFVISLGFTLWFLIRWYRFIYDSSLPEREFSAWITMILLPLLSFMIIVFTLRFLASFDVVDDFIYIVFYILLGYAWLDIGLFFFFPVFDISWRDDVLNANKKAALFAVSGGFIGLTAIYAGANVGDGPGWWCVLFAGGLGLVSWYVLAFIADKLNHISERITIDRDLGCGLRFGAYVLAMGIVFARACAGDWTSFSRTVVEFGAGWPALCLTAFYVLLERFYYGRTNSDEQAESGITGSIGWALIFIAAAILIVVLLGPLPQNPMYSAAAPIVSMAGSL